jgi:hypothetical protein
MLCTTDYISTIGKLCNAAESCAKLYHCPIGWSGPRDQLSKGVWAGQAEASLDKIRYGTWVIRQDNKQDKRKKKRKIIVPYTIPAIMKLCLWSSEKFVVEDVDHVVLFILEYNIARVFHEFQARFPGRLGHWVTFPFDEVLNLSPYHPSSW